MKSIFEISKFSNATLSLVVHTFPDPTCIVSTGLPQIPKEISLLEAKVKVIQEISIDMCT